MSLKQVTGHSAFHCPAMLTPQQEIETWVAALAQYDNHEFEEALKTFDRISDTSKILFNCGMIHATLGQHAQAVSVPKTFVDHGMAKMRSRSNAFSDQSNGINTSQLRTFNKESPIS